MNKLLNTILAIIFVFLASYYALKARVDYDYPKYYDMKCIVIREGNYNNVKGIPVPNTYIVIQDLKDSSLTANLNSLNFPSFVDYRYKKGDTLYFEFISKNRFGEN